MILKIAWRNVWRSPLRSLVVIGAIIVGVWSIIFLISMMTGMINNYVDSAISNEISHLQLHHQKFSAEKEIKFHLDNGEEELAKIRQNPLVKAATMRSQTNVMLASAKTTRGVKVMGVNPDTEKQVTGLHTKIKAGDYFEKNKKNSIVLSERLAEKLKVKLRSKVVLTFQDLNGDITSGAFRVVGLFNTDNYMYDESVVFVRQLDLNKLLGKPTMAHEIAIVLNDLKQLEEGKESLMAAFPNAEVQTYREVSPELELFQSQISMASMIYIVIFMLALVFGIINTMLMAVLERMRELGMLMAVGMGRTKVFLMVVVETLMLALVAGPIGILLGYLTISYYGEKGLDIFAFSAEGMKQFGMSSIIYPQIDTGLYLQLGLAVCITAILGALYPAYKAIRLRPVDAIRH